jgi:ATP-dependent RNA helicase DeaD
MQMPTIEDVNERRVARFNEKLAAAIAANEGQPFLPLIEAYERENNVSAAEIAAALASIAQGTTPLLLEPQARSVEREQSESSAPRRERAPRPDRAARDEKFAKRAARLETERSEPARRPEQAWPEQEASAPAEPRGPNRKERRALERAERERQGLPAERETESGDDAVEIVRPAERSEEAPARERAKRPSRDEERASERRPSRDFGGDKPPRDRAGRGRIGDDEVETYRIEVGEMHGVKPGNIVGAIANEAGLEGRNIGRVLILDDHSFVDLPSGMPKEIFRQLQKVRVAGQQLQISRALKTQVDKLRRERSGPPKFAGKAGSRDARSKPGNPRETRRRR